MIVTYFIVFSHYREHDGQESTGQAQERRPEW